MDINVESIDEVRYYVKAEKGTKQELRDYFSFMVPGAQFMPMFNVACGMEKFGSMIFFHLLFPEV